MFDLISLLLIFIEKSIAINIPYNFVAVTYSTYLIYTRGVEAFWNILLISFIVSLNSIPRLQLTSAICHLNPSSSDNFKLF